MEKSRASAHLPGSVETRRSSASVLASDKVVHTLPKARKEVVSVPTSNGNNLAARYLSVAPSDADAASKTGVSLPLNSTGQRVYGANWSICNVFMDTSVSLFKPSVAWA